MVTQCPYLQPTLRFTSWESSLECATEIRSQTGRQNGRSWCIYDYMWIVHVRHSSSCSSSCERLCREFTFHQKPAVANIAKQLFNVTEKLIRDQKEISGISVINWQQLVWQRTTLLTDQSVQFVLAKNLRLLRYSVLCMGGIRSNPVKEWKERVDWFMHSRQYRELDRIDGELMECRVWTFSRIHHIMDPRCDSKHDDWNKVWSWAIPVTKFLYANVLPPLYGVKKKKGNREASVANSVIVADYARQFAQGDWSIIGTGSEKKRYGTHVCKPNGEWDDVADIMMVNFSESGHPVFRGSSAFGRGDLKSEGNGKLSTMAVTKPSKWFFVQLFPSISSVSTEQ